MLTRRALLATPAMFGPWRQRPDITLDVEQARIWLPGGGVFTCPSTRVRLLAVLRMRAMTITAVTFAADSPDAEQDLLALIDPDGRLLALERLNRRHKDGAALVTRLSMLPDHVHLSLQRDATMPPRRESWTDYLQLDANALTNAPPRPVRPGTMQHALAKERANCAEVLRMSPHAVLPLHLALLTGPVSF